MIIFNSFLISNYSHINIKSKKKIINLFKKYKIDILNIKLIFSDYINRVNLYLKKKQKQIYIFNQFLFIINPNDKEKRKVLLQNIYSIKSIKNTSFLIIECKIGQDEIIESFRKKEIMVFLKKLITFNKNLKINFIDEVKSTAKNSKGDILTFDPFINLKNENNYFQNLMLFSSKIGNFTIGKNKLIKKEITVLGILTNLGILCLNNISYKIKNFISLVGLKCIYNEKDNFEIILKYETKMDKLVIKFSSNIDKKEWLKEIYNVKNNLKLN